MHVQAADKTTEMIVSTCDSCGGSLHSCFSHDLGVHTEAHHSTDGAGELYTYLPVTDNNAAVLAAVPPETIENSNFGFSVGRGSWTFNAGAWNVIAERVVLNDPGKNNGGLSLLDTKDDHGPMFQSRYNTGVGQRNDSDTCQGPGNAEFH